MTSLNSRIDLLDRLGKYMISDDEQWLEAKDIAISRNSWFTPESIDMAVNNITDNFLQKEKLENWVSNYSLPQVPKKVGIVMAGNIPLVGFHDFLCGFISGHTIQVKLSSKDEVLIRHLVNKLAEWESTVADQVIFADNLKGCDAYIATGSNNTSRYFEQYFNKYPNIIRRNRTSVAVLDGAETDEELKLLGRDIFSYFGLGCRNVSKVYIPAGYDIQVLLDKLSDYSDLMHHHKYKNNYDYYLAIYLLNKVNYYTNDSLLAVENTSPFSAVSVLNFEYYDDRAELMKKLDKDTNIQCIISNDNVYFGNSQSPTLTDYADGIDIMAFLANL